MTIIAEMSSGLMVTFHSRYFCLPFNYSHLGELSTGFHLNRSVDFSGFLRAK